MMPATPVRVVDVHTWVTPFGVQFFNAVTGDHIKEGLRVTAWAVDEARRRIEATATPGGTYALHRVPGLGREARGRGDEKYWSQPPRTRRFAFEVLDVQSRFIPVGFDALLPARGLFRPDCPALSPPLPEAGVRLYPRPTRPAPQGMATVRAELRSTVSDAAASWARIVARYQGRMLGDAIADENGIVQLNFPYPEPPRPPLSSPPVLLSPPGETTPSWAVELLIFHSPALSASRVPDYCALQQQPAARLLEMRSPPRDISEVSVELGREAVVATAGESCLFVAPA